MVFARGRGEIIVWVLLILGGGWREVGIESRGKGGGGGIKSQTHITYMKEGMYVCIYVCNGMDYSWNLYLALA